MFSKGPRGMFCKNMIINSKLLHEEDVCQNRVIESKYNVILILCFCILFIFFFCDFTYFCIVLGRTVFYGFYTVMDIPPFLCGLYINVKSGLYCIRFLRDV
jgi:hypothetical protein